MADEGRVDPETIVIPDLKERRKERRRSGATYFQGPQPKTAGLLAVAGGEGPAVIQRAIGDFSAALGLAFAWLGVALNRIPGALTKNLIGLFWAGMAALAAFMLFFHKPTLPRPAAVLDVASASVRPHPQFDSVRLKFASESAGGAISWAKPWNAKAEPPKDAGAAAKTDGKGEKDDANQTDWAEILAGAGPNLGEGLDPGRAGQLSGAALSTMLGGSWGDKNVFATYNAGRWNSPRPTLGARMRAAVTRAMHSFPRGARRSAARSRSVRRGFARLAMGQLYFTQTYSVLAAASPNLDTASSLASDAFMGSATSGGTIAPDTVSHVPIVPLLGSGAPNPATPGAPIATPVNMTPYQGLLDQAKQNIQQSAMLKILGMLLLAIGAVLAAFHPTRPAGIAMIIMGLMMLMMSMMMGKNAKQMGQQIQRMQGQITQNNVVDQCATQAMQNGTSLDACQHDQAPSMHTTIQQDVNQEMNATWTWDDESGNQVNGSQPH